MSHDTMQPVTATRMKAFVLRAYGGSEQLDLATVDKPVPAEREVLVRVRATSVQPYDWHGMRGEPRVARLMTPMLGLLKPKLRILGADVAGQVEAVGEGVARFSPGDEVFALAGRGGFGEYVCVEETELAPMPRSLSFEQAAAVPLAAMTALLAVRDQGQVQPGQRVLINGASGGVGTFAVQLARAFGAEVTGVCSARNADLVRSLGAHEVIDYTTTDFTQSGQRYDVLVDNAGSRSVWASRRVLKRDGIYVVVGGQAGRWIQPAGHTMAVLAAGAVVSQRMVLADVVGCTEKKQNLITLTKFIEDGKVTPVIDRRYRFDEIPAAVRYVEAGHAPGKVVVTV
jgi:NADPH:quinone reductase-like Zn-dependent oxidoreductase